VPSPCHITAILVVALAVTLQLLPQLVYPPDTLSFSLDESVANDGTTRNVIATGVYTTARYDEGCSSRLS
jgi:hypothetical protein